MTLEELKVVITAQTSGLKREIDNVQRQLGGLEKSTSKATNSMNSSFAGLTKTLGKLATAVASIGVIKIGIEGVQELDAAQASLSALNRVLGVEATDALQVWADNVAKNLGLGRAEALKTAQFMGSILTGFIDPSDVAQATTQLVGQMAVIAGATKKPMAQIQEAVQSAFMGSFEQVENILPTMTRALADNYAMVYYNAAAFSKLTNEQQRFIMYQMIMAESAGMYGTSLGENMVMMNNVKAALQDMKLQFGAAFGYILSVVMPVIQVIVTGLQYLLAVIAGVAQAIASLFGKSGKAAGGFANDIKSVAPNMKAATPAVKSVSSGLNSAASGADGVASGLSDAEKNAKKLKGSLMGFDEINTLNMPDAGAGTTGSLGGITMPDMGGIATDLGSLGGSFDGMFEKFNAFSQKLDEFKQKVKDITEGFVNGFKKALPYITGIAGALALVMGVIAIGGTTGTIFEAFAESPAIIAASGSAVGKFAGKIATAFANLPKLIMAPFAAAKTFIITNLGAIGAAFGGLLSKIPELSGLLSKISKLSGIGQAILGSGAGSLAAVGAAVIAVIAAIVGAFVYLWQTSESFRNSWIQVWENIKTLFVLIWETILKPIFDGIVIACGIIWELGLKPLWNAWTNIWAQISGIITDFINFFMPIVNALLEVLGPIFGGVLKALAIGFGIAFGIVGNVVAAAGDIISVIIGTIRGIIAGLYAFVTGVFTGNWKQAWQGVADIFGSVFGGIGTTAKAIINGIISALNVAIRAINKVQIPDWVPVVGGKGINIPEIPRLARGGIVNSGQQYIAGEAGREAIVPLDHNNNWASAIADTVLSKMGGGNPQQNDKPVEVVLQVGSTKLGKVVIDSINKLQSQEGRILLNI